MTDAIPVLIPVLAVDDIAQAKAFYAMLGFAEIFSFADETGRLVHAHLRKGDSALFLGRLDVSHHAGSERASAVAQSEKRTRGLGATFILQVDNLADIHARMRDVGARILSDPVDEYYGDRVFSFVDPFGYEWKISQPLQAA